MRARGQGAIALFAIALVLGGGILADRIGSRDRAPAQPGSAPSGVWLCPHGGGPDWTVTVYLANPGASASFVRVTSLSRAGADEARELTVAPGTEVRVGVPAAMREASTYVEYFGGWIGAGWVARGGAGELGIGAEPCAPTAASTWFAPDGSTEQGQRSYLVLMNPFAADAVLDVALFTEASAPIRSSKWTDLLLPAQRSVALSLNAMRPGEDALAAEVDVRAGRVAVSTLGIDKTGGIRSVIGATSTSDRIVLPAAAGAGRTSLLVAVFADREVRFGATQLSSGPPQPAGGLIETAQPGTSAKSYPVIAQGPSAIDVLTQGGAPVAAIERAAGRGNDSGATGGALSAAVSWVVLPTVAGEPSRPGVVLANPGNDTAVVTLHLLPRKGLEVPADVELRIPPASVAHAPAEFLAAAPDAAVLVTCGSGSVVAAGASTSLGTHGLAVYALSIGLPLPTL